MRILLIVMVLLSAVAEGADVSTQMKQIVALRSEIEGLGRELESESKERQADLDVLIQKKSELRSALEKENLRQLQIQENTRRLSLRVKSEDQSDPAARAAVKEWIAQLETWVRESLPFRTAPRLAVLAGLNERLSDGLETTEALAADLWQFVEDEINTAQQSEFRLTEIPLEGRMEKAEVARLGYLTFFARTPDEQVFTAVQNEGKWTIQPLADSVQIQEAQRLIQNLKSRKKSGLYQLSVGPWGTL